MKKHTQQSPAKASGAANQRVEQRRQKQNQVAQLGAANVEESPRMDRGDSAEGTGESMPEGRDRAPQSTRRGALDTQYGTRSSTKTGPAEQAEQAEQGGRTSSGGSGSSTPDRGDVPNPGSSEESTGADRDTMTGPRPGSGA
jgi:hypothetical protein